MKRPLVVALAAGAALLATGAAHAADVHWSIGIGLPPVATVVSNGPVYGAAPVVVGSPYYAPEPVYAPAPVVVEPPVVYRPWHRPHYVYERPVVVYHGWRDGRWDRDHDGRADRGHEVRDGRRWHQ